MAVTWVSIDEQELERIQAGLGAILDKYRGKHTTDGDMDTLEVSRAEACDDLSASQEFEQAVEDFEAARVDFLFDHPMAGRVRVQISTRFGSIWVRTVVPEE